MPSYYARGPHFNGSAVNTQASYKYKPIGGSAPEPQVGGPIPEPERKIPGLGATLGDTTPKPDYPVGLPGSEGPLGRAESDKISLDRQALAGLAGQTPTLNQQDSGQALKDITGPKLGADAVGQKATAEQTAEQEALKSLALQQGEQTPSLPSASDLGPGPGIDALKQADTQKTVEDLTVQGKPLAAKSWTPTMQGFYGYIGPTMPQIGWPEEKQPPLVEPLGLYPLGPWDLAKEYKSSLANTGPEAYEKALKLGLQEIKGQLGSATSALQKGMAARGLGLSGTQVAGEVELQKAAMAEANKLAVDLQKQMVETQLQRLQQIGQLYGHTMDDITKRQLADQIAKLEQQRINLAAQSQAFEQQQAMWDTVMAALYNLKELWGEDEAHAVVRGALGRLIESGLELTPENFFRYLYGYLAGSSD